MKHELAAYKILCIRFNCILFLSSTIPTNVIFLILKKNNIFVDILYSNEKNDIWKLQLTQHTYFFKSIFAMKHILIKRLFFCWKAFNFLTRKTKLFSSSIHSREDKLCPVVGKRKGAWYVLHSIDCGTHAHGKYRQCCRSGVCWRAERRRQKFFQNWGPLR